MQKVIQLNGENLDLDTITLVAHNPGQFKVELSADSKLKVKASRDFIDKKIKSGEVMYGINTGFGAFSSVVIPDAQIEDLQRNLIRSHSAGIGPAFSVEETRAIMLLRANTLARGHSGVRVETIEKFLEFLNRNIIPVVPSQGSVGASGDLAPLSHLALGIIGEGDVYFEGQILPAQEVLAKAKVEPLVLKAKEGLSLINGCQVMTAIGLLAMAETKNLLKLADIAAAMSLEGCKGSRSPFDPLIAVTRPHFGEKQTAQNMLKILSESSEISDSHLNCGRVQDAYSFRCIPAVHGAAKSVFAQSLKTLLIEANSSTDNPLVFADSGKVLSCGNFHGEPVAFAMDFMGIAISALGNISERRIAKLIDPDFSELPAFLAPQGGLNSGLMIVQVAAASLVSENKVLSHPASVDSVPTSSDKEDHVSMGTIAARKFKMIKENVANVIAMELLSGSQAIDLLAPLRPAAGVLAAYSTIRKTVPFAKEDRVFAKDVMQVRKLIDSGEILSAVEKVTGELSCLE